MHRTASTLLWFHFLIVFCLLGPVSPLPAAESTAGPGSLEQLQRKLAEHIAQPKFSAASWGIKVGSLDSGLTLFEHNPTKLFSPASNSKLYTVALALDRLGEDYRIRTSLYAKAKPTRSGTIEGDLVLYGRGDPSINARLHNNDVIRALQPLVSSLTNNGVRRIQGDLVVDESFFSGPQYGSGWAWDDAQYYYGAPISALTINDNVAVVTVKPGVMGERCLLELDPPAETIQFVNKTRTVPKGFARKIEFFTQPGTSIVHVAGDMPIDGEELKEDLVIAQPAQQFGLWLIEALRRNGVKFSGKIRHVNWLTQRDQPFRPDQWEEVGQKWGVPMRELAREVQKPSQNLYTDLLLAHVGEVFRRGRSSGTSEDLGIAELNEFLSRMGIPRGQVLFEEGSGLSRNNLTTPEATLALLRYMQSRPSGAAYLEALPIAGVDGTLRRRLKGTAAEGNMRAKTGTLRWANSLSGHVTTAAGERLVFSIMLNRYYNPDPSGSGRNEIDFIATALADFAVRTDPR